MEDSSSSSSSLTYDVFLNFRGQDTRERFVCHLHKALERKTLKVYIDKKGLKKGDDLSDLLKAIAESRLSILVFSENYASSTWCLKELVQILECKAKQKQIVMPIFYRVDPSHIRKQTASFGEAFAKHERNRKKDKKLLQEMQRWRSALEEATNLAGWDSKDYEDDAELIEDIVKKVFDKVNWISPDSTTDGLVAMDSHLHEMRRLLVAAPNDVVHVGICGMGGIGKTTIADALYRQIAHHFDHRCFLKDVREGFMKKKIVKMQLKFLSEILNDKVEKLDGGYMKMLKGLGNKKILVVLDNVLDSDQMDNLLGKKRSFGGGSIIIVTTRDEHVVREFKIYKPRPLCDRDALKLFCQFAFNRYKPCGEYEHLSRRIVEYAHGLPLALTVLGALLRDRSVPEWEDQFKKMTKYPNPKIEEVLKISYDGLDHSQQNIFLDIACFFRGMDKDYVTEVLVNCGYSPNIDLNVLVERTLVSISESNKLEMHDLLQEMGRQIEYRKEDGKRRRFWSGDAERVLTENTAAENAEGLMIDSPNEEDKCFNVEAFVGMRKLRLLIFNYEERNTGDEDFRLFGHFKFLSPELRVLIWHRYPVKCLPFEYEPNNLFQLDMPYGNIEHLWKGSKCANNLRSINLSGSRYLKETPDLTDVPNLEKLVIEGCSIFSEVHPSVLAHKNIAFLSLRGNHYLKRLPSMHMKSLKTLNLNYCLRLESFPEILEDMEALSELKLLQTAIKELPSTIERFRGLKSLEMAFCSSLIRLPDSICNLTELRSLDLTACSKLQKLPENIGNLETLLKLQVENSGLEKLPVSIIRLKLSGLSFRECRQMLAPLLSWPSSINDCCTAVVHLDFSGCNLMELSNAIAYFPSLKVLALSNNNVESLPSIMIKLASLEKLELDSCRRLRSIPKLSSSISYIDAQNCTALKTVSAPQSPYDIGRCFIFSDCSQLVQEDLFRDLVETHFPPQGNCSRPFYFSCPGNEIPEQFIHQCRGSSLTAKLPPNWFDNKFLGFAICAVTSKPQGPVDYYELTARCFCTFVGDHCQYRFSFYLFQSKGLVSNHILVGYEPWSEFGIILGAEVEEHSYTEAKFEIELLHDQKSDRCVDPCIEMCGVRFFLTKNVADFGEPMVEVNNSDISSDSSDEDEQYLELLQVFKGANRAQSNITIEDNEDSYAKRKSLASWTQEVIVTSGLQQGYLDDGFNWYRRRWGIERSEYVCHHRPGCWAEAIVPTPNNPTILEITYVGRHTCWKKQPMLTHQVRVTPGMGVEGPFDGFRWGKYDQTDIPGDKFPRVYYVCTPQHVGGCMAVKEVQRSNDQNFIRVTYRLRHTCILASTSIIGGNSEASGASRVHDQAVESPSSSGASGHGENVIGASESPVDDDNAIVLQDASSQAIDVNDMEDRKGAGCLLWCWSLWTSITSR